MTADSRPIEIDVAAIRSRLAARVPRRVEGDVPRRAAIAAILRSKPLDTELLLIKRAERDGDPWSGHMALPGGHFDPRDSDLLATAQRETLEEVGLDLRQHELLGALDQHDFSVHGHRGLVIAPFVFALRGDVELRPNHEVAELLWGSLGRMARGETDVIKEQERDGRIMRRQGFGVGEHVVWGMTHRVLQSFFDALGQ